MLKSQSNLTLAQVYPEIPGETDLNCCGNPDCGNYGVPPETVKHVFKGPNAGQRRLVAAISDPTIGAGLWRYRMESEDRKALQREADAFGFSGDPIGRTDGRVLTCQHVRSNAECGIQFSLVSNQHFEEELDRLLTQNGLLLGPSCGHCGKRYLEAPEEFVFNGANGKPGKRNGAKGTAPRTIGMKAGARARARSVRVIHKPCRGKPGARFTVSSDHRRQQNRADNIQILTLLANGAGAHDLR